MGACGNRSVVSKGVWAWRVHTPGSVHRTDRSRRGSWWRGESRSPPAPMRVDGPVEHPLRCARVCAVTNLPTPPLLKPGRHRPTYPWHRACRPREGSPAYAAPVRSTAPAGTVPSRAILPEGNHQLARQRDDADAALRRPAARIAADTTGSARSPAATAPTPRPFPRPPAHGREARATDPLSRARSPLRSVAREPRERAHLPPIPQIPTTDLRRQHPRDSLANPRSCVSRRTVAAAADGSARCAGPPATPAQGPPVRLDLLEQPPGQQHPLLHCRRHRRPIPLRRRLQPRREVPVSAAAPPGRQRRVNPVAPPRAFLRQRRAVRGACRAASTTAAARGPPAIPARRRAPTARAWSPAFAHPAGRSSSGAPGVTPRCSPNPRPRSRRLPPRAAGAARTRPAPPHSSSAPARSPPAPSAPSPPPRPAQPRAIAGGNHRLPMGASNPAVYAIRHSRVLNSSRDTRGRPQARLVRAGSRGAHGEHSFLGKVGSHTPVPALMCLKPCPT